MLRSQPLKFWLGLLQSRSVYLKVLANGPFAATETSTQLYRIVLSSTALTRFKVG
jgi:hypothetical protein